MKKRILIVEDELDIVRLIQHRLNPDLFEIDFSLDGQCAMDRLIESSYHLVILDIMLPKVDGLSICNFIHKNAPQTFIFIISALGQDSDKIAAYEMGADMYICKPFSPKVFATEIMALFRRCNVYQKIIGGNEILLDEKRFKLAIDGHDLQLTPSEYLIFKTLYQNKKQSFSRSDLVALIYDEGQGNLCERSIDSHIAHIRKKLEPFDQSRLIETVRGKGYAIHAD